MKKKKLTIILSVIVIIIMIILIIIIKKPKSVLSNGEITITLYQENHQLVSNKKIKLKNGTSFEELLKENYHIKMDGTMLIKIGDLETLNTREEFIKIYLNCSPSNYGIKQMKVKDGDEIVFAIEKVKSNGDFNEKFC